MLSLGKVLVKRQKKNMVHISEKKNKGRKKNPRMTALVVCFVFGWFRLRPGPLAQGLVTSISREPLSE